MGFIQHGKIDASVVQVTRLNALIEPTATRPTTPLLEEIPAGPMMAMFLFAPALQIAHDAVPGTSVVTVLDVNAGSLVLQRRWERLVSAPANVHLLQVSQPLSDALS